MVRDASAQTVSVSSNAIIKCDCRPGDASGSLLNSARGWSGFVMTIVARVSAQIVGYNRERTCISWHEMAEAIANLVEIGLGV